MLAPLVPFELFLSFHPAPRWNVARFGFGLQGAGLYIPGAATLTNSNVYDNEALGFVCSLLNTSSIAPLERYLCSWLAGWRGTPHLGHGNAVRHQRIR